MYSPHLGTGEHGGVDVDRIRGLGHEREIAGLHQRPHQVGETFLGPDRVEDFGLRIEFDAVFAPIPFRDRFPQVGDAPGRGVGVVLGVASSLNELLHHRRRRWDIGVPKTQVDDVDAGPPGFEGSLVHLGEDVGRQVVDPAVLHVDEAS